MENIGNTLNKKITFFFLKKEANFKDLGGRKLMKSIPPFNETNTHPKP